jgi:hypothetical protein
MTAAVVGHYIEARRAQITSEGLDVEALLRQRQDSDYGAEILARFGRFCADGGVFHETP